MKTDLEKILKKLDKMADELVDENYHQEAGFIFDLIQESKDKGFDTPEDVLRWISKYNWYQ